MKNLEKIVKLLYKKMEIQAVIEEKIDYKSFDEKEFLRIANAYIFYYSENELENLFEYFVDLLGKVAHSNGRYAEEGMNVFEPCFYYTGQLLTIRNNEIVCRYSSLLDWREMTTELGEDMFVAAYLAQEMKYSDAISRGFCWKRVIGHDNTQLNAVIRRGVSENHSHLNGAAPIFQISWISLMNNVSSSKFGKLLLEYDQDRRYTNVAYRGGYKETSLYQKYMQAALIRLLLYSKLTGKRLKIGNYTVKIKNMQSFLKLPRFYQNVYENEEPYLSENALRKIKEWFCNDEREYISLKEVIYLVIEKCFENSKNKAEFQQVIRANKPILDKIQKISGNTKISCCHAEDILVKNEGAVFSEIFLKLICIQENVFLEDIQEFFVNEEIFVEIWDRITLKNVKELLKNHQNLEREQDNIQSIIIAFRHGNLRDMQAVKAMDYALHELKYDGSKEAEANFIFAGERWLLYMMFRKIYLNQEQMQEYFNLFYAYLLIKENIRSELVQVNRNVGFRNFEKYQNRKGGFLADKIYENEFTKKAVSENWISENILKMELRIAPKLNVESNYQMIKYYDNLIAADNKVKEKLFYTIHFIKSADNTENTTGYTYCRHYEKRKDIEIRAIALTNLREKCPHVGRRILGIDAASNEIGCRPEVFAVVFRYLKNHKHMYQTEKGMVKLPQLNATYHVGEDFLDLADGLRAIEEAVLFLNMQSGDRLGHALALGVDVKEWYKGKGYRIILSVQDYLDNLVWIYHKLFQYDIRDYENLKEQIQSEFSKIFTELYHKNIQQGEVNAIMEECANQTKAKVQTLDMTYHRMDMGLFNYYRAWQLRGDDPELYEFGYFDESKYLNKMEKFRVNFRYPDDFEIRRVPEIALLYYMYHYNQNIKKEGSEKRQVQVSSLYIGAVAEIQKAMQREIMKKGIAIETNPSSNYQIGTFKSYEKHPIIQFYNKGLVHDEEKLKECPQLSVSINTDDQGVFSTSLENEYAIMACALEGATDENDDLLYNATDIYDWLDRIRIMGNEQSFANLENRYYEEDNDGM